MWFLPSYGRPANAQRAVDSMVAHGMTAPGVLVLNQTDPADYKGIKLPDNWTVYAVPGDDIRVNDCWRAAFDTFPNEPWYGLMTDDLVVKTAGFEQALVETAGSRKIVSSNDLWQAPSRMNGAVVFGGDIPRLVGSMCPIPSRHCFFDDFWEMLGRDFGIWDVMMGVEVEHLHPYAGKAASDATYVRANSDMEQDRTLFTDWCRANKGDLYAKVGAALGKQTKVVNLSGTKLVIATPTHDGRYSGPYLRSMLATRETLRGLNVSVDMIVVPGESLITRARNHIVRQFRQTDGTHLLMIDEDMGWDPQAVVRLLVASQDVDLVGGAGPRKATPLTFCANLPNGGSIELHQANGLLRVDEVGCGFMMMTRKCIDLMHDTYLELRYLEPPAMIEISALFDCMIQGGRYWSEDFAFCRRWRMLGGTVWVDPQITLEHVGNFTWKGDFHTFLVQKHQEQEAEKATATAAAAPEAPAPAPEVVAVPAPAALAVVEAAPEYVTGGTGEADEHVAPAPWASWEHQRRKLNGAAHAAE